MDKVRKLDPMIAEKLGYPGCYPVSGQTYSRKVDSRVLNILAGIAQSAHKFSNDIRLLQHLKDVYKRQDDITGESNGHPTNSADMSSAAE